MPEPNALTHSPESPDEELKRLREQVVEQAAIIEGQTATIEQMHERIQELEARLWLRIATTPAGHHPQTLRSRSHHHARDANPAGASPVDN